MTSSSSEDCSCERKDRRGRSRPPETSARGIRLDYGTLAGRRDAEALLTLIDNPRVIAEALAAARILAPDCELLRFARSAEAQRLFRSS